MNVVPEPVIVTADPPVTVKSLAATVAASRVSLEVSMKAIDAAFAGSAWPVACSRVSVGAAVSYVTVRSVPPAVVCALPAISLTEKSPLGATVTAPSAVAVTVTV